MIIAGSRSNPTRRPRLFQPNATSAAFAARLFADQLDAPARSKASTTFIKVSTTPRTLPVLASIR
ncbi:hypothetical protein ACVWWR_001852 [Bradyrhizobium sp. LM3.2]